MFIATQSMHQHAHSSIIYHVLDNPIAPGAFEKHGGRAASKKWRETIWIIQNNHRLRISQVEELDEYLHTPQRKHDSTKKTSLLRRLSDR